MPSAQTLFTNEEKDRIKSAILKAELDTSGEIRVHIENHCKNDVLDRAAFLFKKLDMHQTEHRNGVLFYLAVKDRKFAIIGDEGINLQVEETFWEEVKQILAEHFKRQDFVSGLESGIEKAGQKLKKHFPHHSNDINELSDEISFGS
jgi:uncharacterized membrane protein